jgi:7-cyano-7-deazaguanine reductase
MGQRQRESRCPPAVSERRLRVADIRRRFYCSIGGHQGQLSGGMKVPDLPKPRSGAVAHARASQAPADAGPAAVAGPVRAAPVSAVRPDLLETFAYEFPGSGATVDISTDEFTAVCPWSGLPDFGTVAIRYLPRTRVLELRSFKYYLLSYRNVGIYQEHVANRILNDLVAVCEPEWMEIVLDYRIRGGVHTVVRARWPRS